MPDLDAPRPVTVRGVTLGSGTPAVIVPLTARNTADLLTQAAAVVAAGPDLVEWRVDHLIAAGAALPDLVAAGRALVTTLRGLPLLTTIRTTAEGGAAPLAAEDYLATYTALIEAGLGDLVDVELRHSTAEHTIARAHQAGMPVIASNHDFDHTPAQAEIERRMLAMAERGADVLKIAVMPQSPQDVLTLLSATLTVRQQVQQPLITMAMGQTGVMSRLAGGVFGSAATFGTVGAASAPGQVDLVALRQALRLVHG